MLCLWFTTQLYPFANSFPCIFTLRITLSTQSEPAWKVFRQVNVDMSETVNAGLAVTSRNHDELSEATFYDYEISLDTASSASESSTKS